MPNITCCPDRHDLQRFSLDQLPAAEIERLERHLNECGACLAALEQLASANSLVDAVRGQIGDTGAARESSMVRELMARLQGQPSSAALEATAELVVTPVPSSEDATLAPDVRRRNTRPRRTRSLRFPGSAGGSGRNRPARPLSHSASARPRRHGRRLRGRKPQSWDARSR